MIRLTLKNGDPILVNEDYLVSVAALRKPNGETDTGSMVEVAPEGNFRVLETVDQVEALTGSLYWEEDEAEEDEHMRACVTCSHSWKAATEYPCNFCAIDLNTHLPHWTQNVIMNTGENDGD